MNLSRIDGDVWILIYSLIIAAVSVLMGYIVGKVKRMHISLKMAIIFIAFTTAILCGLEILDTGTVYYINF